MQCIKIASVIWFNSFEMKPLKELQRPLEEHELEKHLKGNNALFKWVENVKSKAAKAH